MPERTPHPNTPTTPLEIKKYPNRRFYDVTRSRHATLNDLYELVRDGARIVVTDSKTGADITNVVLTQIILEHDPPKLDLFPSALLHQAIQSNQQMIRQFIDRYFAQAMDAFVSSRRHFDEFLAKSGFSALSPAAPLDWVRMLLPGAPWRTDRAPEPLTSSTQAGRETVDELRDRIAAMSEQIETLRETAGQDARRNQAAGKRHKGQRKKNK